MSEDYIGPEEAAELVRAANMARGRGRRATGAPPSGESQFGPVEAGEFETPTDVPRWGPPQNTPEDVATNFGMVSPPIIVAVPDRAPTHAPTLLAVEFAMFPGGGLKAVTLLTDAGSYELNDRERERLFGLCADVIKRTTQEFMKSLDSWGTKKAKS